MTRFGVTYQQSLLTKVIAASFLIIGCVAGMMLANLWTFRDIEQLFLTMIDRDVTHISANARLTRDLSQVFTETHLLLSTFLDRPAELREQGESLLTRLNRHAAPSQTPDSADELDQSLLAATSQLRALLDQCAVLNDHSQRLTTMQQELLADLTRLDDAVAEKMMMAVAEGRQAELTAIQQLSAMLSGYREKLLHIIILVSHDKSEYLIHKSAEDDAGRTEQFETIFTTLTSNLTVLTRSGEDLRAMGKHLSDRVTDYQQQIRSFHESLSMFPPQLVQFNALQNDVLTVLGTIEAQVVQTTATMKQEATGAILSSRRIVVAFILVILVILIGIASYLFKGVGSIRRLATVAGQIAQGDLTDELPAITGRDEIGSLAMAFREMMAQLTGVVRSVKTAAQDVTQRSREMSAAAEQMSQGAAEQATATEEVSSSMEEMAANIRQTADNARLTEGMALKSAADARAGKQAVTEIIQAMEVIAERISVVQEIAGQTNILSLNATIEAAKAQDFGKGFSVVASSVRDLARQSRTAADEIRTLVHSCVALSAQAGEVLQRLVPNSEKTAELVQEISASSQEQSTGVEHVNQAVQQLDNVTQHTAATAEEVAATAESLTTQADALQHTIAFFTVNEAQPMIPTQEEDVLRLLQGISKERLAALLTSALSDQPQDAKATPADLLARTPKPSEARATPRDRAIDLESPTAGDERDQEFEHF